MAVELPLVLREGIADLRARLEPELRGWRWVRAESIHLTVRFLGEVAPALDERSRDRWREAASTSEPFRLRLGDIGWFPPRGVPRVLWVGTREVAPGGALLSLVSALENVARDLGWPGEHRPFRPHLTLARHARSGNPTLPETSVRVAGGEDRISRVVLFRSCLEPSGARYTALESFPLGVMPGDPGA